MTHVPNQQHPTTHPKSNPLPTQTSQQHPATMIQPKQQINPTNQHPKKQQTRTTTSSQPINDTQPANKSNKTQPSKPNHHTNQPTPNQKQPIIRPPGCLRYTKLCWVGKHVNMIMKPTNSPTQGPTQPKNN